METGNRELKIFSTQNLTYTFRFLKNYITPIVCVDGKFKEHTKCRVVKTLEWMRFSPYIPHEPGRPGRFI